MRTDSLGGSTDYDRIVQELTYTYDGVFSKESVAQAVADARVHNAGRSQTAAALAQHLSGGRVHVRSAGSAPVGEVNATAITVLKERGIDLSEAYPKPLSDDVVRAADVVITMGCGDACPIWPGKRYEDWDVADPAGQPVETVRDIRDDIQGRVTQLLRDLGI